MLGWLLAPALLAVALYSGARRSARFIRREQRPTSPPPSDPDAIEVTYEVLPEDVSDPGGGDDHA